MTTWPKQPLLRGPSVVGVHKHDSSKIIYTIANIKGLSVNFINVRRAAFAHADPKSIEIQSSCQYFFALLGSMSIKAAYEMLMKSTTGRCPVGVWGNIFQSEYIIWFFLVSILIMLSGHNLFTFRRLTPLAWLS